MTDKALSSLTQGSLDTGDYLYGAPGGNSRKVQVGTVPLSPSISPTFVNGTFTGYLDQTEISTPANPAANVLREFTRDDGGLSKKYFVDSAGNEVSPYSTGQGATITALKALPANLYEVVIVQGYTSAGDGGGGAFRWDASDLSTEVAADTYEGVYAPPDSDSDGSNGAWVRIFDGQTVHAAWFGLAYSSRAAAATNGAIINNVIQLCSTLGIPNFDLGEGIIFNSVPIIHDVRVNIYGAGVRYWVKQGSNSTHDVAPTQIVMTGTGSTDQTLFGVSSMQNWGAGRTNPSARSGYNDSTYKLTNFVTESSSASGRSLISFSAAWKIEPAAGGSVLRGFRVIPDHGGDEGLDGYSDSDTTVTTALSSGDWDIGLFVNGAQKLTIENVQFVGQWRMRRGLLAAPHRKAFPATLFNTVFRGCTFSGTAIRSVDHAPVVATTSTTVDFPWADDHPFGADGDMDIILTLATRTGDEFSFTGMTKVTGGLFDILRLTGVSPDPTAKAYKGAMVDYRGGGTSHLSFPECEFQGFPHGSNEPSENEDLGGTGLGYSNPVAHVEISGNELTEIDLRTSFISGYETVAVHLHDCRNIYLPEHMEMNNGGRLIASPAKDDNSYGDTGYSPTESLDVVFDPLDSQGDGALDMRPYITAEDTGASIFTDGSDNGFFEPVKLRSYRYGVMPILDKGVYLSAPGGTLGEVAIGHWEGRPGFFDGDVGNFDAFLRYRSDQNVGRLRKPLICNTQDQTYIGGTGTEFEQIWGSSFISRELTIADDAVGTFTPPGNGGFLMIVGYNGNNLPLNAVSAMLFVDVGSSLNIIKLPLTGIAGNLDVSTSDVTGTTGTDGNVTVAVQSGVIKIENREGGTRQYRLAMFCSGSI